MDSTDPQPKQQTQQPPPPPPQQQPQQHQYQPPPQPLPQQQRPQLHPQQAQPQPVHPQQAGFPPLSAYQSHPPYAFQHRYPSHQQPYPYAPAYAPYYPAQQPPPTAWQPSPANTYPAQQAQPLANMVAPQPQTNVPQHNKSSQIIGPTIINTADQRLHNQTLQTVTVPNQQAATITKVRERKPAILKDPSTNKEVPLPNTTNSSTATKISTPIVKSSNVEHVHTLLQKVSEVVKEDNKENEDKLKSNSVNKKEVVAKDNPPQQNQKDNQKSPTIQKQQQNDKVTNNKLSETKEQNEKQRPQADKKTDEVVSKVVNSDHSKPSEQSQQQPKEQLQQQVQRQSQEQQQEKPQQQNENDVKKVVVEEKRAVIEDDIKVKDIKEEKLEEVQEVQKEKETKQNGQENGGDLVDQKEDGDEDGVVENQEENDKSNPLEALTYETWQYNPISNREGKKIYSRQFLYDVCEKIVKLDVLQKESDDKIGMEGNGLRSAFNERIDLFAPGFSSSSQRYNPTNRQNEPARRQSQQNYAGRSSAGQERQRKVISSVSLTQEVELKTTSNPWRPAKDVKEDAPNDDEIETESLKKKFRSILNKLTPNNFENLARAVTDLNIDTESKLGEVIDIVFAKALAEPGYCVLYGQMCSHLKKISAGAANFGNTLLRRCQHQFQSDIYAGLNIKERKEKIDAEEDQDVKKQLNEELYEDMFRCRLRGLGLIKFIGELYKIEMLNDKIMFDCVLRLLQDTSEESLECLCDLLATIGEKLDRSSQKDNEKEKKAPKSAPKANAYSGGQKSAAAVVASGSTQQQQLKAAAEQTTITSLNQVFDQLHKIRKNKELDLSVRIRFKLLDTCELREKDNWMSKKTKDNNPKKIDEIREAHKEKLEQERRQQNAMGPRRSQEGRRGLGHSGGSSSQISSLAMESGGNRGQSNMHTSSSSHLIRDHSIGDNMKSNHDDIESQKEHQKKLENLKGISSFLKNFNTSNKTTISSSGQSLRPNTQIYTSKKP